MGSKGKKPCKTCKGSGNLSMDKFEGLLSLVREELSTFMERSMREVLQKYAAPNPVPRENLSSVEEEIKAAVHEGVTCTFCKATPIKGTLYKCFVCVKVNLCAKCEEAQVHEVHPLIKMREPCPLAQLRPEGKNDLDAMLDAVLIKSSIPDEHVVLPGQ